jgi:hypothetical protein
VKISEDEKASLIVAKKFDPDEIRTRNLLIRSQTPYPLGHRATRDLKQQEVDIFTTYLCNKKLNII